LGEVNEAEADQWQWGHIRKDEFNKLSRSSCENRKMKEQIENHKFLEIWFLFTKMDNLLQSNAISRK
jgi:hypothetical protein